MNIFKMLGTCNFEPKLQTVTMNKDKPESKDVFITSIPVTVPGIGTVQITFWDKQAVEVCDSDIKGGDLIRCTGTLSIARVYQNKAGGYVPDIKLNDIKKLERRAVGGLGEEEEGDSNWTEIFLPENNAKEVSVTTKKEKVKV